MEFELPIAPTMRNAVNQILEFANSDAAEGKKILRALRCEKRSRFPVPKSVPSAQSEIRDLLTRLIGKTWPDAWYVLTEWLPYGGIPLDEVVIEDLENDECTIYPDPSCRQFSEWAAVYLTWIAEPLLLSRLHQCHAEDCGDFFLDWPSKRGRPRKRFCSKKCADRERQRQYRSWRKYK